MFVSALRGADELAAIARIKAPRSPIQRKEVNFRYDAPGPGAAALEGGDPDLVFFICVNAETLSLWEARLRGKTPV